RGASAACTGAPPRARLASGRPRSAAAAGGRKLRRRMDRRDDRARGRYPAVAIRGAPGPALDRPAADLHARSRATLTAASGSERARVRGPLRPPLGPPALLHPPAAPRAAARLRLRGCGGERPWWSPGRPPRAARERAPSAILSACRWRRAKRLDIGVLDRDRLGVQVHGGAQLAHGGTRVGGHV